MRLTKLEIYGFKSFLRRTQIVFPQNITGIVGPNGSGKSNISDAVRWVLGEQSARMLRGNSMADVIFNGTEKRRPLNFCEVTLTFDNSDGQLPIAYTEVSVTRRVYRSGEGEYRINGAVCRLRDLVDLFRDTGVGKEGYSIIGQGRIDEILSQRGEDRRAVFEEAAGISRYRARKEEAETRLRHTAENLQQVEALLEEQRTHLGPLKRQAENAKIYLDLSGQLRLLDTRLYLTRHERLSTREAEMDAQSLYARDNLRHLEQELAEIAAKREKCEASGAELERSDSRERANQLAAIEKQHEAREQIATAQARVKSVDEALLHLSDERASLKKRSSLLEATLQKGGSGLSDAQALVAAADADVQQKSDALAEAAAQADALEKQAEQHQQRMMDSVNRLQNARAIQTQQQTLREQMLRRREEVLAQQAAEQQNGQQLEQLRINAEQAVSHARTLLEEKKQKTADLEKESVQMLARMQTLQREREQKTQSARDVKVRLDMLRQLQQSYDGYQSPVRSALSYARKNQISGVRDVLAQILRVPKELETAIDMVLGAAMQNIVTDSVREAKQMIEYLRKNSLGRVTFLPIASMRPYSLNANERAALNMEGCLGTADSLIQFDEEYRPVVQNLLGRTLVAANMDAGTEIARRLNHSVRIVTLQGDVMHSGGSMTGGSVRQKAQNLLGRAREIQECEQQAKVLFAAAKQAAEELQTLEQERTALMAAREQAVYDTHQQEIAVVRDTEHLKTAQNDFEAHVGRLEQFEAALCQLSDALTDIEEKLREAEKAVNADTLSPEQLQTQSEALSVQLDTVRRARERAQEAYTNALLTQQNARHDFERCQSDQERIRREMTTAAEELAALDTREQNWQTELRELQASLAQLQAELAQKDEAVTRAAAVVADLEKKREANRNLLHEILDAGDACKARMDQQNEVIHELDMKLGRIRAQLSQLNDRIHDLYGFDVQGAQEELRSRQAALPEGESLPPFEEKQADADAASLRERIRGLGSVNMAAIEEYADLNERYTLLNSQRDDILKAADDLRALIDQLLNEMKTVFTSQFEKLSGYFAESFVRLFGGGSGEILLADAGDPLNCGIEIRVQPPGKKRQLLSLFSGGERTLTAIALLFAMLKLRPTPFCFLDEIEAALDDANIDNFAEYLKDFSQSTQFVVVTHRKGTMERCDTLFGVAMEEKGVTSMVSVNLKDYEEKSGQEE